MNTLKIKLNPFKDFNIVSLDDKPLSPYSELNNYMKEPFLSWAAKFLDAAEREINDDFAMVVVAGTFEQLFLAGLQNDFDGCVEYSTEAVALDISMTERFELIKSLSKKYSVGCSLDECKIPLYVDMQLSLDSPFVNQVDINQARLIVTDNESLISEIKNNKEGFILLLVSENNKVVPLGGEKYVWEVKKDDLDVAINSIIDRFVKAPFIATVANSLNTKIESIDEEDQKKLSLATEIDPFLIVAEIPRLEVGESTLVTVEPMPASSDIPDIRIIPKNTGIISVEGLNITALIPGTTSIEIYKGDENIPFAKKIVEVFQNNFVKKIDLKLSSSEMGINKKQVIDITCVPADAEDANYVEWTVGDRAVVSINDDGEIIALKEGTTTITATTKMASSSIEVTVLPNIKSIRTSIVESNLYVGQTEDICVFVEPENCFDSSYEWKTSDKTVAVVEKKDDGTSTIRATGIGECILTCEANEGECTATINVCVESTFKKRENAHGMLSLTAVLAIACVFCSALSLTVAVFPVAVATIVSGVLAIAKNKADRFWAFILMAVVAIIALETMGITNIV